MDRLPHEGPEDASEKDQRRPGLLRQIDRKLFPTTPQVARVLRTWIPEGCPSVLDVGCGQDARLLRMVPDLPFAVGVDILLPPGSSGPGWHAEYRRLDIRDLGAHFARASFECVVALDVIEHLRPEEGLSLLVAMEAIAARRVIVFTPNGFLPQPPAANNPHQEHLSGWTPQDFETRGYRVVGINGWRPLRGPYAAIRWRPRAVWRRISFLTEPLVFGHPRLAFQLLCMKDVS